MFGSVHWRNKLLKGEIPETRTAEKSNLTEPLAAEPSFPVNPAKVGTVAALLVEAAGGFGPFTDMGRGGGVFPGRRPVKYAFASAA